MLMSKTCQRCKRVYITGYESQKYCSKACRDAASILRRAEVLRKTEVRQDPEEKEKEQRVEKIKDALKIAGYMKPD